MAETPRYNEGTNANNPAGKTENFVSKHFVRLLVWLAVSGGALAIFGPWLLYVTGLTGETDANLRLHILYITGGTIAVLGLVETHRKNTTDRIKADADIQNYQASQSHQAKMLDEQARQFTETIAKEREKIEIDKAKNEQDHIRQVHTERRSRYATAIEQLADEKAPIRLGGVYTLVKLVDEWLADEKTLPNEEERREEGQVIINSLCAYIRSPFDLASKAEVLSQDQQPIKDPARFREEEELRLIILDIFKTRLSGGTITQEDGTKKPLKGPWSDFDYDFSNAHFFYPVNFVNSYFGASSKFFGVIFTESANFSAATFTKNAIFSAATFTKNVDFSDVAFAEDVYFLGTTFTQAAVFVKATFFKTAHFPGAIFTWIANFSRAAFAEDVYFSAATFTKNAIFSAATFAKNVYFSGATFAENADFCRATFTQDAYFYGATFTGRADFNEANFFKGSPIFITTMEWDGSFEARFSHKAEPEDYNFEVSHNSPYKIETKEQEHNGIKFVIPKDAELFDPDEPSE